jgi:hypothetical protein
MKDKDKEAFKQWQESKPWIGDWAKMRWCQEAWESAIEYKDIEIKKLEKEKDDLFNKIENLKFIYETNRKLEAKNKKLREALEFYSKCDGFCSDDECICSYQIAKEALEETTITTN